MRGNDSALGCKADMVVISGPSGVGKTTIGRAVRDRLGLVPSISATTRPPRIGEVDGADYYFIDEEEFRKRLAQDGFIEYAEVFGHLYGTPRGQLAKATEAGRPVLFEIDVQGGIQVKAKYPDALAIFVVPPSADALKLRLAGRGTDSSHSIEKRFAEAQKEMDLARTSGAYDVEVVNDTLEETIEEVENIIRERLKIPTEEK